jgi:hypothetical protein
MHVAPAAAPADARAVAGLRVRRARFAARHPEWWIWVPAAGGWLLLARPLAGGSRAGETHLGMHGAGRPAAEDAVTAAGGWTLMILAMMLPVIVPRVRKVAACSVGCVRNRAVAQTLTGAAVVWFGLGLPVVALVAALPGLDPASRPAAYAAIWAAVAAFQVTGWRWRALRRCHATRVPRGVRDGGLRIAAGGAHACWCVVACAPAMLTMALTGHSLIMMATVTTVFVAEFTAHRPERVVRRGALIIAAAALFVGLAGHLA